MKKLFLLFGTLFLLASCTKEETMDAGNEPDKAAIAPPIYGYAMLKNVPKTRGVANKMKIWNKAMAQEELSVEFLNGSADYQNFVKEVAHEWEKVADVRFHFLKDTAQEAMIRIGFDYVPGMQSSWSYTGTDHTYLLDYQDEPTMHFARWRRVSDACKRSDVLRAFGQVLGLDLEFRHPNFFPAWKTNEDGTIDEAYIREYWEYELAEFISWAELKTMVLDPINVSARFIAKTDSYDQFSVMCWPFYDELMARNIQPISHDSDYNTELSASDITFIQSLYGANTGSEIEDYEFFPLIEFNYTGTMPKFKISTSKNLGVKWNNDGTEVTRIDLPTDTTSLYTTTVSHTYTDTLKRKIVIGEILEYKQEKPTYSTALKLFDFYKASGADSIVVHPYNRALETVWIRGDKNFIPQDLNFAANEYIKNLYLIGTMGSTVNVDNCKSLEVLSSTPTIYWPNLELPPAILHSIVDIGTPALDPDFPEFRLWPNFPLPNYSLTTLPSGSGVNIQNCYALKVVSLDHTRITNINFTGKGSLEYVYLSSFPEYIIGGGAEPCQLLLNAINTLPSRPIIAPGMFIVRGITYRLKPYDESGIKPFPASSYMYSSIDIPLATYNEIQSTAAQKNWQIVWDSKVDIY